MRNVETCVGGLLWLAVAILLPMAALTPVNAGPAAASPQTQAAIHCADTHARCESRV